MYWLDTTILVVLALGAGLGFWSGLLWQVARVVNFGVSLYACFALNDPVTTLLSEHLLRDVDARVNHGVAYVGVFLAVYLALFGATRLLQKAIKATKLETFDRLLGAALGAAKTALLVAGACTLLAALGLPTTREWMDKSRLAPRFARGAEAAFAWLPATYRTQAAEHVEQLRDFVQRQTADHVAAAKE